MQNSKNVCIAAYEEWHFNVVALIAERYRRLGCRIAVFMSERGAKTVKSYFQDADSDLIICCDDMEKCVRYIRENAVDTVILPNLEYDPTRYKEIVDNPNRAYKTIAMIHNLNYSLRVNPVSRSYYRKVDAFATLNSNLKKTLIKRGIKKPILIYSALYSGNAAAENRDDDELRIVLIGTVEKKKKDYATVIKASRLLASRCHNVKLILLGKSNSEYGDMVTDSLQAICNDHFSVEFYKSFVPADAFEEKVISSDVLLLPAVAMTRYKYSLERYEVTKATGAISSLIQHAFPLICSSNIRIPEEFDSSTMYYKGAASLAELILKLEDKDYLQEMKHNALKNAMSVQ